MSIGQKNMTTKEPTGNEEVCPVQSLLKMLSGKYKSEIFKLSLEGAVRFSQLLREIPGSNKQSITAALRDLEEYALLEKKIVRLKPLHIEYHLTEKGKALSDVFAQLESLQFRS